MDRWVVFSFRVGFFSSFLSRCRVFCVFVCVLNDMLMHCMWILVRPFVVVIVSHFSRFVTIDLLWTCASPCIKRVHMAKNVLLLCATVCIAAYVQKIGFGRFVCVFLCSWLICFVWCFFFSIFHSIRSFSPAWREDFNAFIIGCIFVFFHFYIYVWCIAFIKRSVC